VSEARLRDELCRIGRSLHARGYVHGTTGNVSARLHDGFLISATDACLGDLDPASLVKVDAAGHAAAGAGQPSKTLPCIAASTRQRPKPAASSTRIRAHSWR
jgi:ribulose-5-phosphate 4-epimerase/fuculose-1-phosphate aldolase